MADHVSLRYTFENHSSKDVLVLDRLYRLELSGRQVPDDKLAYVLVEGDEVQLARRWIREPIGVKTDPEVPYATLVSAGASLTGSAQIPLPLTEQHPYLPWLVGSAPGNEEVTERRVQRICVSLGVVPLELTNAKKSPSPPGAFELRVEDAAKQEVLKTGCLHHDAFVRVAKSSP